MDNVETAPSVTHLQTAAKDLARGRIVLGAAAFVAPRLLRRVFGFRRDHENDSAIYFARLYAVRELAFGVHLWWEASRGAPSAATVRVNTAIDGVDAAVSWLCVVGRRDTGRGALSVAAFASFVTLQWARLERDVARYEDSLASIN